jgi:malonyl-CoA O-methyltransferase
MNLSPPPPQFDKQQVRRSFERAAQSYDQVAILQREVGLRMQERLDLIKLKPLRVLDAGCGTGYALSFLRQRYPQAQLLALDIAASMLQKACAPPAERSLVDWWQSLFRVLPEPVCADIEHLPFSGGVIDLVWSNLCLQWANDLDQALREAYRCLSPGGLLMFSTMGPDTLKELRQAFSAVDGHAHVNRFIDLHDVGDSLVRCGFADPVMDMETLTLTYAELKDLMKDLKALGAHNALRVRHPGLMGRGRWEALIQAYESSRYEGKLPASFEVVYGHAWKPMPRLSPSGKPVIPIQPLGAQ